VLDCAAISPVSATLQLLPIRSSPSSLARVSLREMDQAGAESPQLSGLTRDPLRL
jgi:hypothetical protein